MNGNLTAKPGHQAELAEILLEASQLVATAKGSRLYVIGRHPADSHSVYITEIWDSKEDHDQSLKVEGVCELIMTTMPLLEGQPEKGQELAWEKPVCFFASISEMFNLSNKTRECIGLHSLCTRNSPSKA
ncbi:MAG: antibiotic biosynthesis monooxygenase family protein [Cyclobacterium sp.]|uniref:putative quinol monooxygenase n=1 Tax=unclassified Cyclobacterium TaxID=2615055 RepID=UPI001F0893F2|nr:antibiotic biosynthesis monooxygenase family protein [Cyclobacterium sp. SYSU L10401]